MKWHRFLVFLVCSINVAAGQNRQRSEVIAAPLQVRHSSGTASVTSTDPRPLWDALNAMGREYGWVIDYEDPIYSETTESIPTHNSKWESLHPGRFSRIPAGKSFTAKFHEDSTTANSSSFRLTVIQKVVQDYNASDNPGTFQVRVGSRNRIDVIGYSRASKDNQRSLLDTPITFNAANLSTMEALSSFVGVLSVKSGTKVVLGTMPWNVLAQSSVTVSGDTLPARKVLADICDSANVELMWGLLYDFDSNSYFLNLQPRAVLALDRSGQQVLKAVPKSASQ